MFRYGERGALKAKDEALQVHHVFPQKFREEFLKLGINPDNPLFTVEVGPEQQGWSALYNKVWGEFLTVHPDASITQ